jgi:hypothetical protein
VLLALSLLPGRAFAHDIPKQVLLQGFVKPEAGELQVLIRVPLVMLLNLNLPKRGPGFIALDHVDEALKRAAAATSREIVLYENGERLAHSRIRARISQPSDRSFAIYDEALALIEGPRLDPDTNVFWNQGYFDTHITYPIHSPQADFSIDLRVAPGLRDRLKLIVHFLPPEGTERVLELHYGSGPVHLDPHWFQAARTFVVFGYQHILDGIDHLLFLLCLVAPFRMRHFWRLVAVITSFTVAHSITLIAATFGLVPDGRWFPPLVELVIALSIVYMAVENVLGADLRHRWWVSGVFGLVHGFGFSFALQQDLQLAGSHLVLSLLAFNVGVELGQLVFLLVAVAVLGAILRSARAERYGLILLSILVGHTAWHWVTDRFEAVRLTPPPIAGEDADPALLGWMAALATTIVALWLMDRWLARRRNGTGRGPDRAPERLL